MNNTLNTLNKALICNNCLGAQFYKIHNYEFNNPFMWNCIEPYEFVKLIDNFENIDLNNPKIELCKRGVRNYANIIIGDNINFNFIHYLYDESKDKPVKVNADILYKDILKYAKIKYFERLSKLPNDKIFLFTTSHYLNEEHFIKCNGDKLLNKLNELAKDNNIIVILDSQHKLNYIPNFKLIYKDNLYNKSAIDLLYKDNELDKQICKLIVK